MNQNSPLQKPKLRGYFHQEAFFVALGACILLTVRSPGAKALEANLIYSFGLLFLFGVSAIYHRPQWKPAARSFMKRMDHSAIFIVIASTATPICLLALREPAGTRFLTLIWAAAVAGVMQSIFWVKAPKLLTAIFYVAMGCLALPYLAEFKLALGATNLGFILAGGAVYTAGAVFYALKRPALFPAIFGYHELFHVFTIIGAALHFVVIYQLS